MEVMHGILNSLVDVAILVFEFIGVLVIIGTGLRGVVGFVTRSPGVRLNLARGLAMGLEFKLGSEILRTVVVRDFSEVFIVGAVIVLRAALAFLIHWEIKNEEAHSELEDKEG